MPGTGRRSVLIPKLVTTLETYDRRQFGRDAAAGIIVGVVALPLAIAFAIASGVTPDRGLWTAIVAGFLISALGGSRVQIGGPTGAFVVIVYGIVQKHGVDGLMIATLMAGGMLILMGVAKLGAAIKFIPHPVTTGFTSGIAVLIAFTQVKDFLGLKMGPLPAEFVGKVEAFAHAEGFSPAAVAVGMVSLAILIFWPKVSKRIPGPFVALLAATAVVTVFQIPVETIGSRFGEIKGSIPTPVVPHVSLEQATTLVLPAFTIALLGAVESLLSAVVADGMIGGRHRSNMELVAQGAANLVTPLFGGIPATGAIARTATNVKNGGRTPIAGMVHALTLLVITLAAGRWAALIPLPALAAILLVVAYHMSEWRGFMDELRSPRSDVAVLIATFGLTVFVDLTVGVTVGIVLSAFLFMRRMAGVADVKAITGDLDDEEEEEVDTEPTSEFEIPKAVEVYEINGAFFFGAAAVFRERLGTISRQPRALVLRMRHVPVIDSTGIHALRDIARRSGVPVLLSELQPQPLAALEKAALSHVSMHPTFQDALDRAEEVLAAPR
jgi:sulfate permease, SulP family